ncbi:hypothetical protein [Novosphingobium nitrogenifigens]|uniref:hypothetical protein n=1 Tax=Novosphingobium nitrogenifigens TaxID=378548 RepID=UPI0012F4AF25|nr:hypothetical protein [Novosphingobium nitrogenifigens]
MRDEKIRNGGLWIAGGGGILAAGNIFIPPLHPSLFPATIFVAAVAALLFLRMLFSRFYRDGIDLINLDMRGGDPWPGKRKKFFDPDWGLFGIRTGSPKLLWVRAILFLGAMPLALTQAWVGIAIVQLWWASLFVVMILSLMYGAIDTQSKHADGGLT